MTALLRYTGPLRAAAGAVGRAVRTAGGALVGVEVAGRLVRGDGVHPEYRLSVDGGGASTWSSWHRAAAVLADWLEPVDFAAAIAVRASDPDPGGLTIAVDGRTYRLEVC